MLGAHEGNMQVPEEVVLLIRDAVPVHPVASLIQAVPQKAFEALSARYAAPCACCIFHEHVAVNRLSWGFDLQLLACDSDQPTKCVNRLFDKAFQDIYPPYRQRCSVVVQRLRDEWWGCDPADYDSD